MQRSANAPPVLRPFLGDPQKLMLHQLLVSPIFGLATVDSVKVETMRRQYKNQVAAKKNGKSLMADSADTAELRQAIADLPDWSAQTSLERQQIALLQKDQPGARNPGNADGNRQNQACAQTHVAVNPSQDKLND